MRIKDELLVLIPFHTHKDKLDKCLAAVKEHGDYDVKVIEDVNSEGFTPTVNKLLKNGLANCKGYSYFLVLNQDCYINKDTIPAMLKHMEENPKCGITGCKQLKTDDPDVIVHGGTRDCFPAGIHEVGRVSKGDCAANKLVPWVNGAIMLIRRECLTEIGLLDPTMVMFFSDSDISLRARAFGWTCAYVGEASCFHDMGVSQTRNKKQEVRFKLDSLAFRDKWIGTNLYRELMMERL
jgi:GT2 family glycosyltransferase